MVEPVEDEPRLDPRPAPFDIDRDNPVHMLAAIEDEGAGDCLPALRGAAAARQDRDPFLARDRHRRGDILAALRHDDAHGLDLIDRRIGRVAPAAERIEEDRTPDLAAQAGFEAGGVGIVERHANSG